MCDSEMGRYICPVPTSYGPRFLGPRCPILLETAASAVDTVAAIEVPRNCVKSQAASLADSNVIAI